MSFTFSFDFSFFLSISFLHTRDLSSSHCLFLSFFLSFSLSLFLFSFRSLPVSLSLCLALSVSLSLSHSFSLSLWLSPSRSLSLVPSLAIALVFSSWIRSYILNPIPYTPISLCIQLVHSLYEFRRLGARDPSFCSVLRCLAECCRVLQSVAACCSVLALSFPVFCWKWGLAHANKHVNLNLESPHLNLNISDLNPKPARTVEKTKIGCQKIYRIQGKTITQNPWRTSQTRGRPKLNEKYLRSNDTTSI